MAISGNCCVETLRVALIVLHTDLRLHLDINGSFLWTLWVSCEKSTWYSTPRFGSDCNGSILLSTIIIFPRRVCCWYALDYARAFFMRPFVAHHLLELD